MIKATLQYCGLITLREAEASIELVTKTATQQVERAHGEVRRLWSMVTALTEERCPIIHERTRLLKRVSDLEEEAAHLRTMLHSQAKAHGSPPDAIRLSVSTGGASPVTYTVTSVSPEVTSVAVTD